MSDINPRVVIAFKKIFGVEENKDLLISLINSIVGKEDQVEEVTLINPFNLQNHQNDKLSILDIKAKGKDGKRFNIEMQITDEGDYDKRGLYYWARVYTEQLQRTAEEIKNSIGSPYSMLSKTIGIHILNFDCVPAAKKYHNAFRITEKETGLPYFADLELHTIELEKFLKEASTTLGEIVSKVKTSLDRWVLFLTRHHLLDKNHLPPELNDPALKKAIHVLDVMNFSPSEREVYENHLKWYMIELSALAKRFEDGRVAGKAEGEVKGEANAKKAIARKMIIAGKSLEEVYEVTDLSFEEIEKLSCSIKNEALFSEAVSKRSLN